jgi:hypothetical protein
MYAEGDDRDKQDVLIHAGAAAHPFHDRAYGNASGALDREGGEHPGVDVVGHMAVQ